jgi:hypothetical protein
VSVADWKLARKGPQGRVELYDLKQDRTELNNLAAAQPERWEGAAREMDGMGQSAQM